MKYRILDKDTLQETPYRLAPNGHLAHDNSSLDSQNLVIELDLEAEELFPLIEDKMQDLDYAWVWHSQIVSSAIDEGVDHMTANRLAARTLKEMFSVDTSAHTSYAAIKAKFEEDLYPVPVSKQKYRVFRGTEDVTNTHYLTPNGYVSTVMFPGRGLTANELKELSVYVAPNTLWQPANNPFNDQEAFMAAGDQTTCAFNHNQVQLYSKLIDEEVSEFFGSESVENALKELADILVVTIGAIYSFGADPQEVWDLVHASNMSKCTDGKLIKREDGKILKPDTYQAPDLRDLVSRIEDLPEEVTEDA